MFAILKLAKLAWHKCDRWLGLNDTYQAWKAYADEQDRRG